MLLRILDHIDPALMMDMQAHRMKFCQSCENFGIKDVSGHVIQVCGCCNIANKLITIYPEDDNGKCFFYTKSDGTFGYVCPLKKW